MNPINTVSSRRAAKRKSEIRPYQNAGSKGSEITTANGRSHSKPARRGAALLFIASLPAAFGCGKPVAKPASDEPPVLARPTALNDAGQVVGGIHAPDSHLPAFLYDSKKDSIRDNSKGEDDSSIKTTLEMLSLPDGASWALPQGLNAQGLIAGFAGRADNGTRHAVVWQDGASQKGVCRWLNDRNTQSSEAGGVNASGDIVGSALDAAGAYHALKWRVPFSSAPEDLLPLSRLNARPAAINDRGDAAGYMRDAQNLPRLFWLRNGTVRDLGPGYNIALNNRGQAAGAFLTPQGLSRACVWNEAKEGKAKEDENARQQATDDRSGGDTTAYERIELPSLPDMQQSAALALNDRGQIAGRVQGVAGSAPIAVVWEQGRVRDLNDLLPAGATYALEEAIGINNAGQILCAARDKKNFRGEIALLTPVGKGWRIRVFY